jgi:hypothetical protein
MAAPKPVSTTGAKFVLTPARRRSRPISSATALASAGSPLPPISAAAGCGATHGAEATAPPSWSTATKSGTAGCVRMDMRWREAVRSRTCPSLLMLWPKRITPPMFLSRTIFST